MPSNRQEELGPTSADGDRATRRRDAQMNAAAWQPCWAASAQSAHVICELPGLLTSD
jgi:hypothetical protein